MTQEERINKFLDIKEIKDDEKSLYIKTALEIVENSEV